MIEALVINLPEIQETEDRIFKAEYSYGYAYESGNVQPKTYVRLLKPYHGPSPEDDKEIPALEVFMIDADQKMQLFRVACTEITNDNLIKITYAQAKSQQHPNWQAARRQGIIGTRLFTRVPGQQLFRSKLTSGAVDTIGFEKLEGSIHARLVVKRSFPNADQRPETVIKLPFRGQASNFD